MKKKIILALTACLFAAGSIINMHLAQNNHNTDISLADIAVMAQAQTEIPEVPIICNYPGQGWCWRQMSPWPWWQSDCQFTGNQFEYCTDSIPV